MPNINLTHKIWAIIRTYFILFFSLCGFSIYNMSISALPFYIFDSTKLCFSWALRKKNVFVDNNKKPIEHGRKKKFKAKAAAQAGSNWIWMIQGLNEATTNLKSVGFFHHRKKNNKFWLPNWWCADIWKTWFFFSFRLSSVRCSRCNDSRTNANCTNAK